MGKIIKLTESDLTRIVRRVINEVASSNPYEGQYTPVTTLPNKFSAIKFKNPMNYDQVESIMSRFGSKYHFPKNWDNVKGTFNGGEFWSGEKHGTYNISYYNMKDKTSYNGRPSDKKYLMLIKNN
jgi:hypothetical protein